MNGVDDVAMLPEHLLLLGIVVLLGARDRRPAHERSRRLAFAGRSPLRRAAGARLALDGYAAAPFAGQFSVDPADLAGEGGGAGAGAAGAADVARRVRSDGEFAALLLSSLYGVCLMLSADSFLTLFLGLELMSLPVYVLVLLAYRRPQSAEAALKYLVLGGAATRDAADGRLAALRRQRFAGDRRFAAALGSAGYAGARRRRAGDRWRSS